MPNGSYPSANDHRLRLLSCFIQKLFLKIFSHDASVLQKKKVMSNPSFNSRSSLPLTFPRRFTILGKLDCLSHLLQL